MADPDFKALKALIDETRKQFQAVQPGSDAIRRERRAAALRNLTTAQTVLYCGQTQSPLEPTAKNAGRRRGAAKQSRPRNK